VSSSSRRPPWRIQGCLNEAVGVPRRVGESGEQGRAVVVVAGYEAVGDREPVEDAFQGAVRAGPAVVGQVAADDAQLGVSVMGVDVGDASRQPCRRIEVVDLSAVRDQVGIGDLQQLHRLNSRLGNARGTTNVSPRKLRIEGGHGGGYIWLSN